MSVNPLMHELGGEEPDLPEEAKLAVDAVGRARKKRADQKEAAAAAAKQAAQQEVANTDLSPLEGSFDVRWDTLPLPIISALKAYWAKPAVSLKDEWFPPAWSRRAEDVLTTFARGYTSETYDLLAKDVIYDAVDEELARVSRHTPDSKAAFEWRPFVLAAQRVRGDELAQDADRLAEDTESMDAQWQAIMRKIESEKPQTF